MKKILSLMVMALLVLPSVLAVSVGTGAGLDITPTDEAPMIWGCDNRALVDDSVSTGRDAGGSVGIEERINNYAFEGEQIQWDVLVLDRQGIQHIDQVIGTIGATQGVGNDIEVHCVEDIGIADGGNVPLACNARYDEVLLGGGDFDEDTMELYTCTVTVETSDSMYGEYFLNAEAIEDDGDSAVTAENTYWYLNPTIALTIDGIIDFVDVVPGEVAYSETLLVGNDADADSGVLLDMFISGTDFYDPASVGAMCPTSNRLKLGDNTLEAGDNGPAVGADVDDDDCAIDTDADDADHLCYFASSGAYTTRDDPREDAEGYVPIEYADSFNPDFYNDAEIIAPTDEVSGGLIAYNAIDYFAGNVLTPGADMAITFKLGLPEPCYGDFSDGDIYFWGEAI